MHVEQEQSATSDSGKVLLLQHQDLLETLQHLENIVASYREGTPWAQCREAAQGHVSGLVRALALHFRAERESLQHDFADEPALRTQYLALDAEHPHILADFKQVQESLERDEGPASICQRLESAMQRFREHEAQEDSLFFSE